MVTGEAMRAVSDAAVSFESRWTLRSLKLVDPDLHDLFMGQRADWEQALVTGSKAAVTAQTEAMIRAWAAIARRMEEAGADECACVMGQCVTTGLRVAIGTQLAAAEHLAPDVVFMTPDECAALLSAQREILSIKRLAPGATVEQIARRGDEP